MKLTDGLEDFFFTGITIYRVTEIIENTVCSSQHPMFKMSPFGSAPTTDKVRESAENTIDVVSTRLATHLDYVKKKLDKEEFNKYTNELLKNIIIYTACLMEGYWNSLNEKEKERGIEVAEEFIKKVKL